MSTRSIERWTARDAAELYGTDEWSAGYFGVTDSGHVVARLPNNGTICEVSLVDIVRGLRDRGTDTPVLLRFGDILESRISTINEVFRRAMREAGYGGDYRGVYPIKVNQQQQVIEQITAVGCRYHHGLEVGSKAELAAALAYVEDPEALIVCNGYKDSEFVQLGCYAQKMGLNICFVIEMASELTTILEAAAGTGVEPCLGFRIKLASRAGGHWSESGGDLSFFGLTPAEVIEAVDTLRDRGELQCLRALHYHLGSQVPSIRNIRAGVQEATRFYAGLVQEGAPMGILNIGGGLAVDYDGSHTNFPSSCNYTIGEYCADVVEAVMSVADEAGIPHPTIVSESGRATVAFHSVLVFDVLDAAPGDVTGAVPELTDRAHELLQSLAEVSGALTSKNIQECFHDATYYRDEIRSLFVHGRMSLRERALADRLFWSILSRIARAAKTAPYVPDELQALESVMADVYYGNFSVFQSLPDSWAIGQLFPIMPIHRLGERPTRNAVLSDITCDSDGKIDRFVDLHDVKRTLPLHELNGEPYFLGVFLVGAYQETLGDLHNLLGDPNVVGVHVGEDGQMELSHELLGDSVADVLSYVEYDPRDLAARFRRTAERAVRRGSISAPERRAIIEAYEAGLRGYTYFER